MSIASMGINSPASGARMAAVKCVWFTWEDHRRSRVLAAAMGAEYVPLIVRAPRVVRYPVLVCRTLMALIRRRPNVVVCQNPSIVLATVLCMLKKAFGYRLCVDRHSNFKFETTESRRPRWLMFHFLSRFTVRCSDVTIVTNEPLGNLCRGFGGTAVVLQDKVPELAREVSGKRPALMANHGKQILFVTMFNDDEPIAEIIKARRLMKGVGNFYLSGNFRKLFSKQDAEALRADRVFLTGFLPEQEYVDLMANCDVVVVLTTKEYILNCGAYEAVSLGKPLVMADTLAIKEYFSKGVVYVDPANAQAIARGVEQALKIQDKLVREIVAFREEESVKWEDRFSGIRALVLDRTHVR